MLHVNITMLHVDINKLHVFLTYKIEMLHVNIMYLACNGQKYATYHKILVIICPGFDNDPVRICNPSPYMNLFFFFTVKLVHIDNI